MNFFKQQFDRFTNPSKEYRAKPFWAWNSDLKSDELCRQIEIFKQMGFGGFFMHSRIGLKTEYLGREWFELTRDCIAAAEKGDMEAWLYDEDRWPSGPAGGLVTKDERWQLKVLRTQIFDAVPETLPDTGYAGWWFAVKFAGDEMIHYRKLDSTDGLSGLDLEEKAVLFTVEASPGSSWFNGYTYLDTLNEEAVAAFIQSTHERYREEVGEHFGKTVPGLFTDEPNHGPVFRNCWGIVRSMPWTGRLPDAFKGRFGYDITGFLPDLFFDRIGGVTGECRAHYHLCKTELFVNAFSKQVGEWCQKNNLEFTGHVIEEDPISSQISFVGSPMQFYEHMSAPGIDLLTQYRYEYIAAKQCVSVARQMGRKWVMSELYGCTGWETTFETYKHIGDWQAVLGITLRCPHLSWYSMEGEAKRDYPASIHFHSPWWKEYKVLEDYYARLNLLLTEGRAVCELAVIHPGESYLKRFKKNIVPENNADFSKISDPAIRAEDEKYQQLTETLLSSHLDFDFIDEQLFQTLETRIEATESGMVLQVGQMRYTSVLVPDLTTIRGTTLALLKEFSDQGGHVLFAGNPPTECDFKVDSEPRSFAEGKTVPWDLNQVVQVLSDRCRTVEIKEAQGTEAAGIFYQLRETPDGLVLFVVNMNREKAASGLTLNISACGRNIQQVQLWDALNNCRSKIPAERNDETVSFNLDLPSSGSALIVLADEAEDLSAVSPQGRRETLQTVSLDPCSFELDDLNVLVMDRADAVLFDEDGAACRTFRNEEILELDRQIRTEMGIELRGGFSNQPWFEVNKPIGPEAELQLSYEIAVGTIPDSPVFLALEQPGNWNIVLNGQPISAKESGWWVDPSIRKVEIPAGILKVGGNRLELRGRFNRKTDLEIVYVLGTFGVKKTGDEFMLSTLPAALGFGSWRQFGLPFYSGNVTYKTSVKLESLEAARYILQIGKHHSAAVGIKVNDSIESLLFYGEYEVDLSNELKEGENRLEIRLLGSRRNSFGPFHLKDDHPYLIGPPSYRPKPDDLQEQIHLLDYGIFTAPELMIECF
jgi:hypothetical protein